MATKLVVNCATGAVEEIELTAQELAQRDQDAAAYAEQKAAEDAAKAQAEADKEAGKAKLAALGLSEAEIAALVG
jgi:type IV secretory pathway VirB9-like protein